MTHISANYKRAYLSDFKPSNEQLHRWSEIIKNRHSKKVRKTRFKVFSMLKGWNLLQWIYVYLLFMILIIGLINLVVHKFS